MISSLISTHNENLKDLSIQNNSSKEQEKEYSFDFQKLTNVEEFRLKKINFTKSMISGFLKLTKLEVLVLDDVSKFPFEDDICDHIFLYPKPFLTNIYLNNVCVSDYNLYSISVR